MYGLQYAQKNLSRRKYKKPLMGVTFEEAFHFVPFCTIWYYQVHVLLLVILSVNRSSEWWDYRPFFVFFFILFCIEENKQIKNPVNVIFLSDLYVLYSLKFVFPSNFLVQLGQG